MVVGVDKFESCDVDVFFLVSVGNGLGVSVFWEVLVDSWDIDVVLMVKFGLLLLLLFVREVMMCVGFVSVV